MEAIISELRFLQKLCTIRNKSIGHYKFRDDGHEYTCLSADVTECTKDQHFIMVVLENIFDQYTDVSGNNKNIYKISYKKKKLNNLNSYSYDLLGQVNSMKKDLVIYLPNILINPLIKSCIANISLNEMVVINLETNDNPGEHHFKQVTIKQKIKFLNYIECFFFILNKYHGILKDNTDLKSKIKNLESKGLSITSNEKLCEKCSVLKENIEKCKQESEKILHNYSKSQIEKEKMIIKYATSEKKLLAVERSIRNAEKKHRDIFNENAILHKRINSAHDSIMKLTDELNAKSVKITQFYNQMQHYKSIITSKEIKINGLENKIINIIQSEKEAKENVYKIKKEKDILQLQLHNIICSADRSEIIIEMANDKMKKRQSCLNVEHKTRKLQIRTVDEKSTDYKLKLNILNSLHENERNEVQILSELHEVEAEGEKHDSKLHITHALVEQLEKVEFKDDDQDDRQREIKILEFVQKLIAKNIHLQNEFKYLESKYSKLKNNEISRQKLLAHCNSELTDMQYNFSLKKLKYLTDCELLSKIVAKLIFLNQKLFHQLEDIKGKDFILHKRYELIIKEM